MVVASMLSTALHWSAQHQKREDLIMNTANDTSAYFKRHIADSMRSIASLKGALSQIYRARQSRLVIERLLTYDDRMLDDMGVSRSDIELALTVPMNQDPAAELAAIRSERRQAIGRRTQ